MTTERVRNTLAHEMCHLAADLVDGSQRSHGPLFFSWQVHLVLCFPLDPTVFRVLLSGPKGSWQHDKISSLRYEVTLLCTNIVLRDITIGLQKTHSYDIKYDFKWRCVVCDTVHGRHSDSLKRGEYRLNKHHHNIPLIHLTVFYI